MYFDYFDIFIIFVVIKVEVSCSIIDDVYFIIYIIVIY